MKIDRKDFRVREGDDVHLEKWPARVDPVYKSKDQYKSLLEEHVAKLSAMQRLHHASNRHAILLIFQATGATGKDGAIRPPKESRSARAQSASVTSSAPSHPPEKPARRRPATR
jgi:polyphosphate kinase 2 (PPK2 family)